MTSTLSSSLVVFNTFVLFSVSEKPMMFYCDALGLLLVLVMVAFTSFLCLLLVKRVLGALLVLLVIGLSFSGLDFVL